MKIRKIMDNLLTRFPVKVVCVSLAIILYFLFRLNTLAEIQFNISLQILIPDGFVVSSDIPHNINVLVRGNRDDVNTILSEDIEAYLELSDLRQEGEFARPVILKKTGTALQAEAIELRPQPMEITLSLERKSVRSIAVIPEVTGFPATGYKLTRQFVSPSSVNVEGPISQMNKLTELKTELIDISGREADFSVTTRIVRPSNQIEIPGGQVVEYRGFIEESFVLQDFENYDIVIFDLPDYLKLENTLPTASLTVQGSQLDMDAIKTSYITFSIDGSQITAPGNYVLPLDVDVPDGLVVLKIEPREVEIQVVGSVDEETGQ